jgi:hypothetical protein
MTDDVAGLGKRIIYDNMDGRKRGIKYQLSVVIHASTIKSNLS